MANDESLPAEDLEEILRCIEPGWTLVAAHSVESGYHRVYRLTVNTAEGTRDCYLKVAPLVGPPTVRLGGRMQVIVTTHTHIPVPTVHGILDHHEALPTPLLLMSAMPGDSVSRVDLDSIPDDTLRSIARASGRQLADFHALDAVDSYGYLTPTGPKLTGEAPSGRLDTIAVAEPTVEWTDQLTQSADRELRIAQETRLADLVPRLRPVLESRIAAVEGPFEPVLARIDHSIENILLAEGEITAVLDWGFTIAATRGYDLVHVTRSLAGGPYLYQPEMEDRRQLIKEALLAGYCEATPHAEPARIRANWPCYELLASVRSMGHLESWFETFDLGPSIDDAVEVLRQELLGRR